MLAGTAELYRSDPHRLRRLETLADSSVQAIAAIMAGGLVLFAVPFVETWLGPGYGDAALCVQVLALAALINAWSAPWTYYAIGRGRYSYVLISAGVTLAVNAAATIILTSRIGLNGALIGSLAGSAAGTATARLLLLRWERRNWLSPAVRATGIVGLLVVPALLIGVQFPASWLGSSDGHSRISLRPASCCWPPDRSHLRRSSSAEPLLNWPGEGSEVDRSGRGPGRAGTARCDPDCPAATRV